MTIELDHVLVAVTDLVAAATRFAEAHDLDSIPGGRHPDWGTANRIVPLGATYLELIAAIDPVEAAESPLGRWVAGSATASGRLLGWAVRTTKLDEIAQRLDLVPVAGSRATSTGDVLHWRTVGVDEAIADPSLPFFIERASGAPFPGTAAAPVAAISRLELSGDAATLAAWLGDHTLPVEISRGRARVERIVLAGRRGEIVIET